MLWSDLSSALKRNMARHSAFFASRATYHVDLLLEWGPRPRSRGTARQGQRSRGGAARRRRRACSRRG
uniref:Uncharacterized protein n=1 Tax=Arundo donax TaxID=35708 RepID=A0A0A9FR23_ARUDO